jgi:hypothetical protein
MAKFRGKEIGVADAEAYVHLIKGKGSINF